MRHVKKRSKASWEFVFRDGEQSFCLQIPVSKIRNFELIRVVFGGDKTYGEKCVFIILYFITVHHTGETLMDSLLVPNFESFPQNIEQSIFLQLCANVRTEASFRAAIHKSSVEFEEALIKLFAILIRIQFQNHNEWASRVMQTSHASAIVSEWVWTDIIPWITTDNVSHAQGAGAEMALNLCKKSDVDWIAHENVAGLWSCLSTRPTMTMDPKLVTADLIQAGSQESHSSTLQGAGLAETQRELPGSGKSEDQSQQEDSTSDPLSINFPLFLVTIKNFQ